MVADYTVRFPQPPLSLFQAQRKEKMSTASNHLSLTSKVRAILRNAKRMLGEINGTPRATRKKEIAAPCERTRRRILELIAERNNLDIKKASSWHDIKTMYHAQLN
jgi:hypothetical protein